MDIQESAHGAVTVLKPQAALVGPAGEVFRTRATQVSSRTLGRIVVDASAIAYVDSAGLEALVDVAEQLAQGGRSLKMFGANPTVRLALELTGWADGFEQFEDATAAVRSFM